jgi:hypothetical protein
MVVIQLSKLTSNPMGSTKTHLDKNEPRGNRVSLILRKRKASYTLRSGGGSMTTQGQILTAIHWRFCMYDSLQPATSPYVLLSVSNFAIFYTTSTSRSTTGFQPHIILYGSGSSASIKLRRIFKFKDSRMPCQIFT